MKKPLVDAIPIEILNGISIIPYPHVFVWLSYLSPIAYTDPLNITMEYASIMVGFFISSPWHDVQKQKSQMTHPFLLCMYIYIYIYIYTRYIPLNLYTLRESNVAIEHPSFIDFTSY